MDWTIIFTCCLVYLLIGCVVGMVSFNDYPLLTFIFWPIAFVIRLITEIIELIGDISDGMIW